MPQASKRLAIRLFLLIGLGFLLIYGIQTVQASGSITATGDTEGYCTSTVSATNGTATVTRSGDYCIVEFKTTTNTTTANFSWTPPSWLTSATTAEYLVVGGGASGNRGICGIYWGQGGGGGGVATGNTNLSGTTSISVGAGGAAGSTSCSISHTGNAGQNSNLGSIVATGGLTGTNTRTNNDGRIGGSSGLPTSVSTTNRNLGGIGSADNLNCNSPSNCEVGGGGGAGGGGSGVNGGTGIVSTINGASVTYGSGGGGRGNTNYGTATSGGGVVSSPNAAQHQGGGGSDYGTGWGAGGSGIVVVKYSIPPIPTINTNNAVVLVDPRAESIRIPLFDLSAHWNNRACITLNDGSTDFDITDADTSEYKVELIGSSGASTSADSSKSLRVHGSAAQMQSVFKPTGESKSFIQIKRPTTGQTQQFNQNLNLVIKSDNSNGTSCASSAPGTILLTATIKPYEIEINQKNEVSVN